MNSQRKFSLAFKVATIGCALAGIVLNLYSAKNWTTIMSYYTMQSNIFVFLVYLICVIKLCRKPSWENTNSYHFIKGATLLAILLTFVLYTVSLSPMYFVMDETASHTSNFFRISNIFVHAITPLMVLIDYILFDEKGFFRKKYIPLWCIFPVLYLIYTYTYSNNGGSFFSHKYAYFFLDVEHLGIATVVGYITIITAFFMLMCYLFIALDKFLAHRRKN